MSESGTYGEALARLYRARFGGHADAFREPVRLLYEENRETSRSILDVCCGTGDWLRHFLEHGYAGVGLDLSPSMLAVAQADLKTSLGSASVHLVRADARRFAFRRSFGLITCLGGVNHLSDLDEVSSFLACAVRVAEPRGLLILDLFLPPALRQWEMGVHVAESDQEIVIVRGLYERGKGATAKISGAIPDERGALRRFEQVVTYHEFDLEEVLERCRATGWMEVYAARPPDLGHRCDDWETAGLAFIVARKPAAAPERERRRAEQAWSD